jgi:hypothetical protein
MATKKKRKTKLPVWDERMILLMRHCIEREISETQYDFLKSIGFAPTALKDVRNRERSFTVEQIHRAALKYGINVNWIFGLDGQMKRVPGKSPIKQLKEAVTAIEAAI